PRLRALGWVLLTRRMWGWLVPGPTLFWLPPPAPPTPAVIIAYPPARRRRRTSGAASLCHPQLIGGVWGVCARLCPPASCSLSAFEAPRKPVSVGRVAGRMRAAVDGA